MPWFWNGQHQGGGVLNDMMCHSILVVRQLLTPPGESLSTLVPKRVSIADAVERSEPVVDGALKNIFSSLARTLMQGEEK